LSASPKDDYKDLLIKDKPYNIINNTKKHLAVFNEKGELVHYPKTLFKES